MAFSQVGPKLSAEAYLQSEIEAPARRELVEGFVHPIPEGSSASHNRIVGNFIRVLSPRIELPLELFCLQFKIRVTESTFYYPDVVVTMDETIAGDANYHEKPIFVAEVLSPLTERTDLHEKPFFYQRIATLREYAIVWQDARRVLLYRKTESGWQSTMIADPDQVVDFESVGVTMTLDEIYRNVRW